MKSKIEKIEVEENLRKIVNARGQDTLLLVDKINEIIDHLNSQDQEEERKLQVEMQDEYPVSHGDEEIKDRRKPHDFRPYYENEEFEDTPEQKEGRYDTREILLNGTKPLEIPEQKEEWEERFVKRFGYWGSEIDFIKDLLLERERWAIDTFLKDTASYNSFHNGRPRTMRNGLSGEGFEVRVSKLSN